MTGCLAKGDAPGTYKLTDVDKVKEVGIVSSSANLAPHVGHKVELTGSVDEMRRDAAAKRASEAERQRFLADVAHSLDRQVKAVADSVGAAAQALVGTARSMTSVSAEAQREASAASGALAGPTLA